MYSIVVFMMKMLSLNGSIAIAEMDYKCCCFAPGTSGAPGVRFTIPETPAVKVGGQGWLPYSLG